MKNLILLFISISFSSYLIAQDKYLTKTGMTCFEASVPSFEEVKAENNNTTAIINVQNGEFAALALVKGYRFKNALMEEHFNENYAESNQYPKATFKGVISDFSFSELTHKRVKKEFSGSLTFHGKTKVLEDESIFISKNTEDNILLTGTLKFNVSDFDIKIPKVVSDKLSREVDVSYEFILKKK